MSTNASITVKRADGLYKSVYCHNDSYVRHTGRMLLAHYSTQELAEALVEPGDLSFVDEKCDKPEGHSFNNPAPGRCVYYARDRGEHRATGAVGRTAAAALNNSRTGEQQFNYLFEDGRWTVNGRDLQAEVFPKLNAS